MKLGLTHCNVGLLADPGPAAEFAAMAELAGVESLWTVDHIVFPEHIETRYPETPDGNLPFPPTTALAEPLTWLAHVAAITHQVRLGTAVVIAPQRETLLLAKQAATVAVLARGRFLLGVGVGWMREEFESVGADFERRGKTLDAQLEALRNVWHGRAEARSGPGVRHPALFCHPTPPGGTVPVHVGGYSLAAARRAARLADGFFPGGYPGEQRLDPLVRIARDGADEAGRDGSSLEVTLRWTRSVNHLDAPEPLRVAAALGADRVTVPAQLFLGADAPERLRRVVDLVGSLGRHQLD